METTTTLAPGARIGNYLLESLIGSGAFAQVWKARHHERNRVVAVKIAVDPTLRKQLQREARLPEIDHPNVVPILDSDTRFADPPYVVMPYMSGGNLAELIKKHPNGIPEDRVEILLKDVLSGLAEAHGRGIVHRDIKPSNILLNEFGSALIADFGLSANDTVSDFARSMVQSTSLSGEGIPYIAGTYAYMAPDLMDGTTATPAGDVYSVGIVLFEMLVGRRPHGLELPSQTREHLTHALYWDGLFYWACCRAQDRHADAKALKAAANGIPRPTPIALPPWRSEATPAIEVERQSLKAVALGLVAFVVFAVYSGFSVPALVIAISLAFGTTVHLLGYIFVALAAGLNINEVQLAFGKPLFCFRFGVLPVKVGYLPWGGSVRIDDIERRSAGLRFLLHVAGPLAVMCLTGVCIGYDRAAVELASGFRQIIQGALAPLTAGEHLVGRFFGLVESAPFLETIGVLTAKIAAFNLLPLPPNSGGLAVLTLFPTPSGIRSRTLPCMFGLLIQSAIIACWVASFFAYIWDSH